MIYAKRDQLKAINKMNLYDCQKAALHSRAAFYLSLRSRCIFSWHERQRLIRLDTSFDPPSARETEMAGWAHNSH